MNRLLFSLMTEFSAHLLLLLSLLFVLPIAESVTPPQIDLALFRDECPCLRTYGDEPIFDYFAYDLDSCNVYCIGSLECEAISYCYETRSCRGYDKYAVGFVPEAISNWDCLGNPSESATSGRRWYWIKEVEDGETIDCQDLYERGGSTPAANSYELITVRGYPVHVYCAWPDAENTEARTFLKLRTDAPSSFSVWGGVKPGIKADIDSWYPYGRARRDYQKVRLRVDKCLLAANIQDLSYTTLANWSDISDKNIHGIS
ncbi:uncharacterized protein LOC134851947 [Symsagittifera roscoffensis]|uniref:uncharacterized protein LOC134851947 n=1 Tax=Symsagittifera roscoffensis TaxID=84072 RepID=UPI00307C8A1B